MLMKQFTCLVIILWFSRLTCQTAACACWRQHDLQHESSAKYGCNMNLSLNTAGHPRIRHEARQTLYHHQNPGAQQLTVRRGEVSIHPSNSTPIFIGRRNHCTRCYFSLARSYEDSSFDAVVDKGTLDALMSEDTAEVRESGEAMLREVKRVLKPTGRSVHVGANTMYKCTAAAVAVARAAFPATQLVLKSIDLSYL